MRKEVLFGILFLLLIVNVSAIEGCYSRVSSDFCSGLNVNQCDFYSRGDFSYCTLETEICLSKNCVGLDEEKCLGESYCEWGKIKECTDSEPICVGDNLREYSCVDSKEVFSDTACALGCSEGQCLTLGDYSCIESENGIYKEGTNFSKNNFCVDNNFFKKYSCDGKNVLEDYEYCPGGCADSICKKEFSSEVVCEDPDNFDLFVSSEVNKGDFEIRDYCENKDILVEFECNESKIQFFKYDCEHGCQEGRCLRRGDSKVFDLSRLISVELLDSPEVNYSDLEIKGIKMDKDLSRVKFSRDEKVFVSPIVNSINVKGDYTVAIDLSAPDGIVSQCEYRVSEDAGCSLDIPYYDNYTINVNLDFASEIFENNKENNMYSFDLDYGCKYCSLSSEEGKIIMIDDLEVALVKKSFLGNLIGWFSHLFKL